MRRAVALLIFVGFAAAACSRIQSAPFPEVDRNKLSISLTRGACFGTCPDYKVTIDGRGHVIFSTREDSLSGAPEVHREFNPFPYLVAPGRREYDIDPKVVDALLEKFRDAEFFSLKNEYIAQVTDSPTYAVEIDTGNGSKQVVDYVGGDAGMPAVVTQLEEAIDKAAGTTRWVRGGDGLVEALAKEDFNFRSETAARMLVLAIEDGGDGTLLGLLERGAPLDLPVAGGPYGASGSYGKVALLTALREGRSPLFTALVAAGWLKKVDFSEVANAFVDSGAGCRAALVDAVLVAGIPVDVTSSRGGDALSSDGAETALSSIGRSFNCQDESSRVQTASRLLARGANPNHRDDAGKTAIFGVENLDLLNLLFSKGADPKVVDNQGNSAVFDNWTDEIVLRLLDAGASSKGSYDGSSLWEQMKKRPMPKVKAWLTRHPTELAKAKSK